MKDSQRKIPKKGDSIIDHRLASGAALVCNMQGETDLQ